MLSPATPDTIVAISTPPGRGGIGIVRLSGTGALATARRLLRLSQPLAHAQARFARILDSDGVRVIDEAVVTAFLGPNSYTGEDLVEIAAHGSPVVLDHIVQRALSFSGTPGPRDRPDGSETVSVRLAEAGEFSRRAFLAGRLDLTQAEAIHDLIAAQTLAQARTAAQQLGGSLSRRVLPVKTRLLHLIAMLEAGMDFATGELDDVDTMPPERIAAALDEICQPLLALAASFHAGSLQRNGVRLALVGRPNAGKSSLFNRLLDRDRAIVTAAPGTTRDTIEEVFSLDGIPVRLVDTAGLRTGGASDAKDGAPGNTPGNTPGSTPSNTPHIDTPNIDEAEALGIARSREALADADLILLVTDASEPEHRSATLEGLAPEARPHTDADSLQESLGSLLEGRPVLRIRNKIDLAEPLTHGKTPQAHGEAPQAHGETTGARGDATEGRGSPWGAGALGTSALTGEGIAELRAAILAELRGGLAGSEEGSLSNLRQHQAVLATLAALAAAAAANTSRLPHELLLVDLHTALTALDTLTGQTTSDDILGLIFSTFCIGK